MDDLLAELWNAAVINAQGTSGKWTASERPHILGNRRSISSDDHSTLARPQAREDVMVTLFNAYLCPIDTRRLLTEGRLRKDGLIRSRSQRQN